MLDVLLAIVFFAIFSISMYKVVFNTGASSVVQDLDTAAAMAEYKNTLVSTAKAFCPTHVMCPNNDCTSHPAPALLVVCTTKFRASAPLIPANYDFTLTTDIGGNTPCSAGTVGCVSIIANTAISNPGMFEVTFHIKHDKQTGAERVVFTY